MVARKRPARGACFGPAPGGDYAKRSRPGRRFRAQAKGVGMAHSDDIAGRDSARRRMRLKGQRGMGSASGDCPSVTVGSPEQLGLGGEDRRRRSGRRRPLGTGRRSVRSIALGYDRLDPLRYGSPKALVLFHGPMLQVSEGLGSWLHRLGLRVVSALGLVLAAAILRDASAEGLSGMAVSDLCSTAWCSWL